MMNKQDGKPRHIAIVMDGNGRWAKKRGESRIEGHIKAKKSVRESIEFCVENKITYLSLFAFSFGGHIGGQNEILVNSYNYN